MTRVLLPCAIPIAALLAACGHGPPPAPAPDLAAAPAAAPVPAAPAPAWVGVITSRESKIVASEVDGRLDQVLVQTGQHVTAGQPLARLDASELAQQVAAARAAEDAAKADAAKAAVETSEARRVYRLQATLYDEGASARESVRTARADLGRAGADATAAAAALRKAHAERAGLEDSLAHATITAPIDGVVSLVKIQEGEVAHRGTPIARVFDPSDLRVRFAVPHAERARVAVGAVVEVTVPGVATPLAARVLTLSDDLEPPLELAVAEADLDDRAIPKGGVQVGVMAEVRAPAAVAVAASSAARPGARPAPGR